MSTFRLLILVVFAALVSSALMKSSIESAIYTRIQISCARKGYFELKNGTYICSQITSKPEAPTYNPEI